MKIQGKEIDMVVMHLDPITYVPNHADGNASHPDCERGVLMGITEHGVRMLNCKTRTIQLTYPEDLVWG